MSIPLPPPPIITGPRRAIGALRWAGPVLVLVLIVAACAGSSPAAAPGPGDGPRQRQTPDAEASPTPSGGPVVVGETGFDDHTVPRLGDRDAYFALAADGPGGQSIVKFTIPDLLGPDPAPRWMDSHFYELHDEWYWFRLLNGRAVPAIDVEPVEGLAFDSIADVYAWATANVADLPLDLRFTSGDEPRLYSTRYYDEGLGDGPRNYGLGSVVHVAESESGPERWLLELEYSDDPSPAELAAFFDALIPTLPGDVGAALEWVVRSPHQEAVAREMETASLAYHDRIVRYDDFVPAGEVTVYNNGIAAGRLLYIGPDGAGLGDATDEDILLMEHVPDWLPPGAALLTDAPQTPLAHVNLLARNRGIPNASRSGVIDDAGLRQAARVRAHAIVRADDDGLDVVLISREAYDEWLDAQSKPPVAVPTVDPEDLPLTVSLVDLAHDLSTAGGDGDDLADWRPIIGGKATGFLTLIGAEAPVPPDTAALTVRPYLAHLDEVLPALEAMLDDPDFESSPRARFLLLEGPTDYPEVFGSDADAAWAASFASDHARGTPIGDILAADGFKGYFRDVPLDSETLAAIEEFLRENFEAQATTQGLRFRSSSSVEDVEGFNGAGLYDSNTGFLEGDDERTIEWAIKKTWASYWGFEAFEERRIEHVDHLSGAMAVLVHARFDDEAEENNGVATLTILPPPPAHDGDADSRGDRDLGGGAPAIRVVINTQGGAESVTNPDPTAGALPEIVEVSRSADGEQTIDRVAVATTASGEILSDEDITDLADVMEDVALLWRARVNAALPPSMHVSTVTLDFEFKTMAEGWPARADGVLEPRRLVVKQARSLDPGLRGVPTDVLDLPIPRDLLARARLVRQVSCDNGSDDVTVVEVFTDPLTEPDMGYSVTPFVLPEGAEPITDADCRRRRLHATPDQLLVELLEAVDLHDGD